MSKVSNKKMILLDRLSWKGILPHREPLDDKVNGAKVYSRLPREREPERLPRNEKAEFALGA